MSSAAIMANGHARVNGSQAPDFFHAIVSTGQLQSQYLSGGRKSLPGLSVRAFFLGITLGVSIVLSAQLVVLGYGLWRVPFFIAVLSGFHYLEFDMTARFNPSDAKVSSFLLFNNGAAYNIAHTTAIFETTARYFWYSGHLPKWLRSRSAMPEVFPTVSSAWFALLGIVFIVFGQAMRSLAMAHAKTNFNHIVQSTKKVDHVLITSGVYAWSRHPSYFGFFWWGLGTQLMLGNIFCFIIYVVLLWSFFSRRIRNEEKHLISFFGDDYMAYRKRVGVGIPFIQ